MISKFPFHEPELNGRVDQAQRIHPGEQRSPVAFCAVVDPLRLIHPTIANRVHGSCAVSAAPKQAARDVLLG